MGKKSVSRDTRLEIVTINNLGIYSNTTIASMCHVSEKCVRTTLINNSKNKSLEEKKRSGAPRKTTEKDDEELIRLARTNPTDSLRILSEKWSRAELSDDPDNPVKLVPYGSYGTVRNRLVEIGLESHPAAEKPSLTDHHKKARLNWCIERRNWSYSKWANVIFSDESNYKVINRKTTPTVWRFRDERFADNMVMPRKQGGGGSLGIWGCIGELGTGCCTVYPGRMNQWRYLDVLENQLKPSIEVLRRPGESIIFQQDGATCHTAKSVKAWFKDQDIELLTWPANSPDLSPIENIWAEIDKKLAKLHVTSMAELEDALHKTWGEIDRQFVLAQIESMPRRIEAVISAHGGYTKY